MIVNDRTTEELNSSVELFYTNKFGAIVFLLLSMCGGGEAEAEGCLIGRILGRDAGEYKNIEIFW